jgi:lantibiotic modifying enzyme
MRHTLLLLVCALGAAVATASTSASGQSGTPVKADATDGPDVELVRMAADSLVARHRAMPEGGWAWRSSVQAPHYQTDRDVGAAGIGEGLLAAYAVTRDPRYARAAMAAGDFLLGVAEPARNGLRWPDWADADGERSTTHFTSFDDGAAGISDYLWHLYTVTHEQRFRDGALAGMRWLVGQATGPTCPETACSWRWTDDTSWRRAYYGVGMGQAGIVLALDAFADRTGEASFRAYARSGATLLRHLTSDGARPLPRGSNANETHETGFLNGSAGAALMFLQRYAHDHNAVDLTTARRLLDWVNEHARDDGRDGLSWPSELNGGAHAAGFELGAAGIAWVNLRAADATGDSAYGEIARRAATWLRRVALPAGTWSELPEDSTSPRHVGLDSGAAGIGWVLEDVARAGLDTTLNRAAARSALHSIHADAARDQLGAFWYESRVGGQRLLRAEPSWHWGSAGIAAFGARLAGWTGRGPGAQPTR